MLAHHIDFGDKGLQVRAGFAHHKLDTVVQAQVSGARHVLELLQGPRAYAPRREIDHAQKRGVVFGVFQKAQISECVLDLGALKQPQATIDSVGDGGIEEGRLNDSALGIAAV